MGQSSGNDGAYVVGYALGALIPLWVALWGWRARHTSKKQREATLLAAGIEDGPQDPDSLPPVRGGKRIAIGLTLLVISGFGQLARVVGDTNEASGTDNLRVGLPSVLLGLSRNDAMVRDRLELLRQSLPGEFGQVDAGYYGSAFGGLMVAATKFPIEQPQTLADDLFRSSLTTKARYVSAPSPIDAGPLGGYARCATVTQSEPAPATAYVCAFVSTTSFVLMTDSVANNLDQAADRGRQIRALVVRPVDNPLPSASATPSAARPRVTIRLPKVLLGATIQRKDLVKDRADFLKETKGYLSQADLALYVSKSKTFLVETAAGDLQLRSIFLRSYERQAAHELGSALGAKQVIRPGPLGGDAYCWHPLIEGSRAYLCLFVDDQAYVAVYDLESTRLTTAADLARRVRAAVEKRH